MTITRVVEGNTIEIEDLNQLIDLLEGGNSQTLAFKFVSKTGENFIVKLADAAGARKFSIQDSAGVEVASINSNGEASFAQVTSTGATILPSSTTPADTTEASIQWDSNDDLLVVGTGSTTKVFYPGPIVKTKSADETVNGSDTLQNDDHLAFAVEASSKYWVQGVLYITSGATPGLKYAFSVPSGATGWRSTIQKSGSGANSPAQTADLTTAQFVETSTATAGVVFYAYIETSSTAGTATLQWAQNTSDASNTTVAKGSTLIIHKLA